MKTKTVRLLAALLCVASLLSLCVIPMFADETSENPYPLKEDSQIKDLKVLFCGDSICAAAVYDAKDKTRYGWAMRIKKAYGLYVAKNVGADGASVSNCRGTNTIERQVLGDKYTKYDMIVLHGGTNDGWDSAPVGVMTAADCFNKSDFDVSTFGGGLEHLFAVTKECFPDAKICYLINFKTPTRTVGSLYDMSEYYTLAKQICEKWEIPYMDMYFDDNFNNNVMRIKRGTYTVDKIHPNEKGYDAIYEPIGEFLEEVWTAKEDVTSGETSEVTSGETSEVTSGETSVVTSGETSAASDPADVSGGSDAGHTFLLVIGIVVAAMFITAGVIIIVRKKGKKD